MVSLPADILLGFYLGALVGIVPALSVWVASFAFRYTQQLSLPREAAIVLGLALAGFLAWILSIVGQSVIETAGVVRLSLATLLVVVLSTYAHRNGDVMAAAFPRQLSIAEFGGRGIDESRAQLTEDGDQVRIQVVGAVGDVEGYPILPDELRRAIRNADVELPVDLRLSELERRVEEQLEVMFDLASVSVDLDEQGRARINAAPPFSGLSKRIGSGKHAVTVSGLVPTGIARGDEVTVITPGAQVRGTVISARSDSEAVRGSVADIEPRSDAAVEDAEELPRQVRTPTTDGGEGELTVAINRTDVRPLLQASATKIVVESRDLDREYEVVSMLRRVGHQIQRLAIGSGSELAGQKLGTTALRKEHDVAVLAIRKAGGWQIAPRGETTLDAGDELFAAGTRSNLEGFASNVV